MRDIRVTYVSLTRYVGIFCEITKIFYIYFGKLKVLLADSAFNCTNKFTKMREKLSELGYQKEVEKTDKRFIEKYRNEQKIMEF